MQMFPTVTGWSSDLSSILLLGHLHPHASRGHKTGAKMSSYEAVNHVFVYFLCGCSDTAVSSVGAYLFLLHDSHGPLKFLKVCE